ncbi:MAG: hypothetical protein CME19_02480 [Gemmatimonadetes bacterium]|nr:hypothetical protein [Gemmatimonadota bacterium]
MDGWFGTPALRPFGHRGPETRYQIDPRSSTPLLTRYTDQESGTLYCRDPRSTPALNRGPPSMADVERKPAGDLLPARSASTPTAAEEAALVEHLERYKTRGYTILRDIVSQSVVAELRDGLDKRMAAKMSNKIGELDGKEVTGKELAATGRTVGIGGPDDSRLIGYPGLLSAAPEIAELLIKPFLLNPLLLDLAERVMGPFVQGDGFYVVGTPPARYTGRPTDVATRQELIADATTNSGTHLPGWHRDAYNHHDRWRKNPGYADDLEDGQPYTPPLAAHVLCYLQDMDGPGGPLLAVPGSHRNAFGDRPNGEEDEKKVVVVDAKAGDVVFFHCDMLHSGSANRAQDAWRYMVTSFVVRAGLPHRDDFTEAPLVRTLIAEAEARSDRRVLRFFAADSVDGGPLRREEEQWRTAIDAERQLLTP